ncbi:hypothetical protein B0T25DRAFT_351907 [Lasiosphaeria hispida]|uniref:Uncharacterized protein n=1 Tax=Lasiosphaeria hispida TaxID=260671 RepID=A0AAJ0H6Y0_9PEZI|nr:hypothetical protein B0T25DRAFT_351907 [Lasiosphaeria hispida]
MLIAGMRIAGAQLVVSTFDGGAQRVMSGGSNDSSGAAKQMRARWTQMRSEWAVEVGSPVGARWARWVGCCQSQICAGLVDPRRSVAGLPKNQGTVSLPGLSSRLRGWGCPEITCEDEARGQRNKKRSGCLAGTGKALFYAVLQGIISWLAGRARQDTDAYANTDKGRLLGTVLQFQCGCLAPLASTRCLAKSKLLDKFLDAEPDGLCFGYCEPTVRSASDSTLLQCDREAFFLATLESSERLSVGDCRVARIPFFPTPVVLLTDVRPVTPQGVLGVKGQGGLGCVWVVWRSG